MSGVLHNGMVGNSYSSISSYCDYSYFGIYNRDVFIMLEDLLSVGLTIMSGIMALYWFIRSQSN